MKWEKNLNTNANLKGELFLHQLNPELHTSFPVEQEQRRRKKKGEKMSQKPAVKIKNWLEVIDRVHHKYSSSIKNYYYDNHILKFEDFPESFFDTYRERQRNLGFGDIELREDERSQIISNALYEQRDSLDHWINYLLSPDTKMYPVWVKYWIFTSMIKLSSNKNENYSFCKRRKNTLAPFPELNREALSLTVNRIMKIVIENNGKTSESTKFGKLYASYLNRNSENKIEILKNTHGTWVKYDQGTDPLPLVNSLSGFNTGWCTASESMAEYQLGLGDFFVFYSNNEKGEAKYPRVAIRMLGQNIAEMRGIAKDQNLDSFITSVVEERLQSFGIIGQSYLKKVRQMNYLTKIETRHRVEDKLSMDDLRFLYEIDENIEGFGYTNDPRIKEIIEKRDIEKDLMNIFNCTEDEISTNSIDALKGQVKYHHGDLDLSSYFSVHNL